MAKVNLIGIQPLDFVTDDGSPVKGLKLYITYQDDNVMGYLADKKFLSDYACKSLGVTLDTLSPLIGSVIEIETNMKGKVSAIHS